MILWGDAELTRWSNTRGLRKQERGAGAGSTQNRENDTGEGKGPRLRRLPAAHLRVGHNQALVAFAVIPPFILVHLPLVHPLVGLWNLVRPRAGGCQYT